MRNHHLITALALLVLGAMPAVAQQRAAVDVVQAPAPAAAASEPSAQPPTINRWVDERGQVHYGDRQPRKVAAEKVQKVVVKPNSIDTSEGYESNLRMIQQSEDARAKRRQARNAQAADGDNVPPAPPPVLDKYGSPNSDKYGSPLGPDRYQAPSPSVPDTTAEPCLARTSGACAPDYAGPVYAPMGSSPPARPNRPTGPRLSPQDYWPAGPIPPIRFTPSNGNR